MPTKPLGFRDDFKSTIDDVTMSFQCVQCGQDIRFSHRARMKDVKRTLDEHECKPTALKLAV